MFADQLEKAVAIFDISRSGLKTIDIFLLFFSSFPDLIVVVSRFGFSYSFLLLDSVWQYSSLETPTIINACLPSYILFFPWGLITWLQKWGALDDVSRGSSLSILSLYFSWEKSTALSLISEFCSDILSLAVLYYDSPPNLDFEISPSKPNPPYPLPCRAAAPLLMLLPQPSVTVLHAWPPSPAHSITSNGRRSATPCAPYSCCAITILPLPRPKITIRNRPKKGNSPITCWQRRFFCYNGYVKSGVLVCTERLKRPLLYGPHSVIEKFDRGMKERSEQNLAT